MMRASRSCGDSARRGLGRTSSFEPEQFVDVGDERVLVLVKARATGTGSGAPVELRNAHGSTIRNGELVRFRVYGDRDEALEAAGLSE